MPQLLYKVSKLAQHATKAKVGDYQEALRLYEEVKQEAQEGRAVLPYPQIGGKLYVVTFFDASLGHEKDGKSQLGAVHFLTNEKVAHGPQPAAVMDYTCCQELDGRGILLSQPGRLYVRLIADMMIHGVFEVGAGCRARLRIGGGISDRRPMPSRCTTICARLGKFLQSVRRCWIFWSPRTC